MEYQFPTIGGNLQVMTAKSSCQSQVHYQSVTGTSKKEVPQSQLLHLIISAVAHPQAEIHAYMR